jgi:hypothetical protein
VPSDAVSPACAGSQLRKPSLRRVGLRYNHDMEHSPADVLDLRLPMGRWIGGYVAGVFITVVALGLVGSAVVAGVRMGWQLGGFLGLISGSSLALALHTLRDARAKQGLCLRADSESLELRLPAARSLVRTLGGERRRLAWNELAAIETRLEAYRSLGMANMQRAYVLRLHSGELIFLGEDRALGTNLATDIVAQLVARLRERFPVELIDRGMAEGRGGLLGVLFTAPPPWQAENLAPAKQVGLWRAATRPAVVMLLVPLLVLAVSLLSR